MGLGQHEKKSLGFNGSFELREREGEGGRVK